MIDTDFRPLSDLERQTLAKLFELEFVGREQLQAQIPHATVQTIDNGNLQFKVDERAPAAQVEGGPIVEARYSEDGEVSLAGGLKAYVHVVLHIRHGRLYLLEVYKDDFSPLMKPLDPSKFHDLFTPKPLIRH